MSDDQRGSEGYEFGEFEIAPDRQLLLRNGVPVRIGSRAFDILAILVANHGRVVGKAELLSKAWPDTFVEEDNLKVNIAALRRALGDTSVNPQFVASVFGRGYQFVAPVHPASRPNASRRSEPEHNLPLPLQSIIGRTDVTAAVLADLRTSRLVSIVGAGGVGKTTVAVAAAHDFVCECPDGALFIDLATVHEPHFIPAVIASGLGLSTAGGDGLGNVVHALKSKKMLLLVDNCEHLMPGIAATLERLSREFRDLRILATGREQLRIRGERIHRLSGLQCDPRNSPTVDQALAYPAVELFASRALERAKYDLVDEDAPAVAEICRRLDGNPLAIELAATQTRGYSPSSILQMIDGAHHLFRAGSPDSPLRQQSLLATLDWSFRLLTESEADLLCAVAVFAGDFGLAGAQAVSGLQSEEIVDTLAQLYAKSLIVLGSKGTVVRYRLLETTRAYCLDRLRVSGEEHAKKLRHAKYVWTVLQRAAAEWPTRPVDQWGEEYGRYIDDLRSAFTWASQAAEPRLFVELSVVGTLLWNHLSLMNEAAMCVSQALDAVPAAALAGSHLEMILQTSLAGTLMFTRGAVSPAIAAARRALEIATSSGDIEFQLRNLRSAAAFECIVGRYETSNKILDEFIELASAEDPSALPSAETLYGINDLYLGIIDPVVDRMSTKFRAVPRQVPAARLARFQFDANSEYGIVLGKAQWLAGLPKSALRTAGVLIDQTYALGHDGSLCNALAVLACPVSLWSGRLAEAARYTDLLDKTLRRHTGDMWFPMLAYFRGALACLVDPQDEDGLALLEKAASDLRATNHLQRLPQVLGTLAEVLGKRGETGEARRHLQFAMVMAEERNERWLVPELVRVSAALDIREAGPTAADQTLERAVRLAEEGGVRPWQLKSALDLARLRQRAGRRSEAIATLKPILDIHTEGFCTQDLRDAADLLSELQGKRQGAFRTARGS